MTQATILLVEDNPVVLQALKETLEWEGWRVEAGADGGAALAKIEGGAHYDLLVLDNELPGVSGLELSRRVRALSHRRDVPVVMLSASECEEEARRAGVNEFLRKPDGVTEIAETVARLLSADESKKASRSRGRQK